MKIVHALNFYGDNVGTQEVVRNLVRCELEAGYSPEIVTSDLSKNTVNDLCKVKRLPTRLTISRIPFIPSLVPYILKKDADIFHLHGPLPWFDSVLALKRLTQANCKFIYRIQNMTFEHHLASRFFGYGYQNTALRVAARAADVVITMTRTLAHMLGGIFHPKKTAIIRNGIDAEEFTVSHEYPSNIVFVGSIKPDKGVHVLIRAFQKIKQLLDNPTLHLVGTPLWSDAYYRRLRALTKSDSSIIWHGWVTGEKKKQLYANAGVVVLPSVSLTEGFGLVLLEGMASGKPVVASDLPTIAEWVDPSFGVLFQTGNADKLVDAIITAFNNANSLGRTGREYITKFYTWKKIFNDYQRIYEALSGS